MKKFTFFAAFAALAVSANAQYSTATPYADQSVVEGTVQTFDILQGNDVVFEGLEKAGQKTNDWRLNNDTRNLWVWDETFVGGDSSFPGVGYDDLVTEGYPSLTVSTVGWSGAGFAMSDGAGINTTHWTDETKFHIAVRTASVAPESVALVICDGDNEGSSPAKVALGEAFNDGGAIYPTIGPKLTDEWAGIDISFADLKKFYPSFNYVNTDNWMGNILSILAGGVEGRNLSIDCIYFHTPGEAEDNAVGTVADDAQWVITGNSVNVANGNGIALYDLSGRLIKSANGSTLGISDLGNGIYVAKCGNSVKKIMK